MIQSILFFTLGFLCAGFLALMVAPAIWRRAVALTRKRIEASVPLSLAEIQADKDRMRAEFAMATRRLEMNIKALKEKAAAQLVEINRNREAAETPCGRAKDKINRFPSWRPRTKRSGSAKSNCSACRNSSRKPSALEKRALELEKMGQLYDDASFSSSNRQIELVARENEVEKLASDIMLRSQRKEADRRNQEIVAESKAARDALKAEKKRTGELDKKIERMLATLADREDKLDRREKELARLRERSKGEAVGSTSRLRCSSERRTIETDASPNGATSTRRLPGSMAIASGWKRG